ncbi:MAG: TonB-dependent receptor plug domain-containing protein, partial [bacterium]
FSGVSGGGDYSGFLAVRGGSPDQNLVVMDGVVIPYPYRFRLAFGGGLSSINPTTTQDIYLHLGGFSAEYGNSLSSIIEVESRLGNRKHIQTRGAINLTDISGVIEGPFPGGVGSYLFSVRRTYYDLVANKISHSNSVYPFYYELNSRWAFDISKNNRVILNFIRNQEGTELLDEFSEDLNLTEKAKSYLGSIVWRSLLGEHWQFNTALSYYRDTMSYRAFPQDSLNKNHDYETLNAKIVNFSFKEDIRFKIGEKSWLNWGFLATTKPTNIDFKSKELGLLYARVEFPRDIDFDKSYSYYATYLESSAKATEKLHLRIGVRYDYSTLINEGELSPRMSIWYQLSDRTTIAGSWGIFYQYPNPITIYTRNVPVDLSSNLDVISAEKATHQIIGIEHTISKNLFAKIQFYNNDIDRLLLPMDENTFLPMNNGRGFSRGFEFILERKPSQRNRISGVLSYAYGNAKFRAHNSDEWLPFKFDRRHALTVLYNMRIVGNWNVSVLGQFSTGFPYTDVLGARNHLDFGGTYWTFLRGPRFGAHFPAYKKMDIRLSYQHRVGEKAFSFYLDIINLTNQKNIYEITWEKRILPNNERQATKRTIYMLPLIPSFGVSFKF